MSNFKKPLIILSLILVFGGVAYWDEWKSKQEEEIAKEKDKLFELQASQISEVLYAKRGEQGKNIEVKLAKIEGKWRVMSPNPAPADADTIDRWLKTIEELRFEKTFDATPDKLKDYGLEQPQISISLKAVDGQEVKVLIGDKSPVGYSSYVKLEGSPSLYLVSHYLYTASNKELADFRDKSIGMPILSSVEGFSFKKGAADAVVLKRKEKDWWIEAPQASRADNQEVESFLAFFERQRVERFVDEASADLTKALSLENEGTKSLAQLKLDLKDGQSLVFDFIENNGVIYTKLPMQNSFAALDRKIEEGLGKTLKDLQYRGMFSFNSSEVTQVEIDGKVFQKKDEQWHVDGKTEGGEFVRLLLVDLEFAKAEEILSREDLQGAMQGKPLHELKIQSKDGSQTQISLWSNPGRPESIFLRRNDDGFFLAQTQLLDNFTAPSKPVEKDKVGGEG